MEAQVGPSPDRQRPARIRPAHLFVVAALLQFVAIPLPWASARILEGSVTIDGFEAALFGFCAFVCGVLCLCAAVATSRDARGWMLIWALPAVVGSLLFASAMVVLDSILANAIEWVFAERAADADAGPAVWLVLSAGLLTVAAVGWSLLSTPLPAGDRPGVVRATLTLPPVLWQTIRRHYRGAEGSAAEGADAGTSTNPPVVPPVALVAPVAAAPSLSAGVPVDGIAPTTTAAPSTEAAPITTGAPITEVAPRPPPGPERF